MTENISERLCGGPAGIYKKDGSIFFIVQQHGGGLRSSHQWEIQSLRSSHGEQIPYHLLMSVRDLSTAFTVLLPLQLNTRHLEDGSLDTTPQDCRSQLNPYATSLYLSLNFVRRFLQNRTFSPNKHSGLFPSRNDMPVKPRPCSPVLLATGVAQEVKTSLAISHAIFLPPSSSTRSHSRQLVTQHS